jgi:hypothetical protein
MGLLLPNLTHFQAILQISAHGQECLLGIAVVPLTINDCLGGYYALIVLLWEAIVPLLQLRHHLDFQSNTMRA